MIRFKRRIVLSCLIAIMMQLDTLAAIQPESFGCVWWAHGSPYYYNYPKLKSDNIPNDYSGKKEILCIHTNEYGLAIDTLHLNRIQFGAFDTAVTYETDILQVDQALFSLPESQLKIEVSINGDVYQCVGRLQPEDKKMFPIQFVEYGRYFQQINITGLIMENSEGEKLNADCRLEIVSWPDGLNLVFFLDNQSVVPDNINLSVGSKKSDVVIQKQRESIVILSLFGEKNDGTIPDDLTVHENVSKITTEYSEIYSSHIINIDTPKWSNKSGTYYPEEHLDRFDKWQFTLQNDDDKPKTFRLRFDTPPRNITGFTPMILDDEGFPTGIPVQISKNWHKGKTPLRYQGSWIHGSTMIEVPPKSTRNYYYAMTYARWGGVPAASHAQLSLIGWGHNMFWDESALGSFGESICYEPGRTQRRGFITDVRPLLVTGKNGKKWGWTGNAGGGDFLVYFNKEGKYVPMIKTRGRYYSYGPNLTKVTYEELSEDESIQASYTVRLARADDYVRCFQTIRYDILKPVEFSRLAFCQMPADYYNEMNHRKIAIGNVGDLISEWSVSKGSWIYDKESIPIPGDHPWVSLHDVIADESVTQAARGFIIRKWDAVFGSKQYEQPHISTYMTEWHTNNFRTAVELSPPANVKKLFPGDFVDVEIELVVIPSTPEIYYGQNSPFISALNDHANTWKLVHREAAGNNLDIRMDEGNLVKKYPIEISVSENQEAKFSIVGGVGYVPITISNLSDYKGFILYRNVDGEKILEDQSVNGHDYWQIDYDSKEGTWSITYNIEFDSSIESGQPVSFLFK